MKIDQILNEKGHDIYTIDANQPLLKAVKLMVEFGVGSLMVKSKGKLCSIITERDVLTSVDHRFDSFNQLLVEDVMAKKLVTCEPVCTIDEAMRLMTHNVTGKRIRHLPVVKDGEVVGLVSIGDIVHALLNEAKFENRLLKNYIRNWPEEEKQ